MASIIKVLFLASEAEPFIKVGGLADVAGSLPLALRRLTSAQTGGVTLDVRLVLPLHRAIRGESLTLHTVTDFNVYRRGRDLPAQVYMLPLSGMPVYFISGEPLAASPSVYSSNPAQDREKFTFFSLAALELTRRINWQPDIVHANDWHTAAALYAIRSGRGGDFISRARTVLTMHNLPYMGGDGTDVLNAYGMLPLTEPGLPPWALTQLLPLGLWSADAIIPVSPTYACEILTPEFGCGLETFLSRRAGSISGILNGLDTESWNPAADKAIAATFSAQDLSGKAECEAALQRQLGLKEDPSIPLLAMIGRVDQQKGVDIAIEALRQLQGEEWQLVVLGSGDPALESRLYEMETSQPERVRVALRFDAPLGRMIYAGANMFLMPSRYEPCGLAQMIAMRYGSVPVVRATGGLKDTVHEGLSGFLFEGASPVSMVEALQRALAVFREKEKWLQFQLHGMAEDFSWQRSARQYARVYQAVLQRIPAFN